MHKPIHYRHMAETFSDLLSDCQMWHMPPLGALVS